MMKWFKHFTDSLSDPFINELMDRFRHQGYVAYFGLIETIAKENGNTLTGKLTINPIYLKRKFRISTRKLEQIYNFCSEKDMEKLNKCSTKPKLLFDNSEKNWHFDFPKILQLKDNYLKDRQAACKKVSLEEEEKKENNTYIHRQEQTATGQIPPSNGTAPESNYSENIECIFEHWNKSKIITHSDLKKFKRCIGAQLKLHTPEIICETIDNYKKIITGNDYFFNYRWTLDEFFSRKGGFDKFLTKNDPFTNHRKDNNGSKKTGRGERKLTEEETSEQELYNRPDIVVDV